MEFREYQKDIIQKGLGVIKKSRFLYLSMEVRTGKTLTAMGIADSLPVKNMLFITKKKAISSIQYDYDMLEPGYELQVINYNGCFSKAKQESEDGS